MDDVIPHILFKQIVDKINNSSIFKELERLTHSLGYFTKFDNGEFKHHNRIDLFVSYSIYDFNDEIIETYDDGYLTAYEPLIIRYKTGRCVVVQNSYDIFLEDLATIKRFLEKMCFVVFFNKNMHIYPNAKIIMDAFLVHSEWSEGDSELAIIEFTHNDLVQQLIGDLVAIHDKNYQIIKIA